MITIWLCDFDGLNEDICDQLSDFLPQREKSHLTRLMRQENRAQKIISRCMTYMAVKAHCGHHIRYDDIWFPNNAPPVYRSLHKEDSALYLSLSHSRNGVAVAVSSFGCVGVDVLDDGRPRNWRSVASEYFPKADVEYLFSLPDDRALTAFRQLWCWKEALVKAAGVSLEEALSISLTKSGNVLKTIISDTTTFHLQAFSQGAYTIGLVSEDGDGCRLLETTPEKILASLDQAGQF